MVRGTSSDPQVGQLAEEVQRRVGADIPRPVVERTVKRALQQWPDARIRDFIPILATRSAAESLRRRYE